ncbi:MAG: AbrB/MazE/SpoVT family DNA-binding domain-containing protein [Microbacterium sp.]
MSLVTVKPKFQVTIPVKLREQIALQEGDVLDAVLVQGGILLRPKAVVDKLDVANQLNAVFAQAPKDPRDEPAIMQEAAQEIAAHRAARRA